MPDFAVGGQAVIEGVMMRSGDRIATAVRLPDGRITLRNESYVSLTRRYKLLSYPVIRGAVAFFEMLIIGISTLNFSAEVAVSTADTDSQTASGEVPKVKKTSTISIILSMTLALGLGVFLFFFIPLWIASLFGVKEEALGFNLLSGTVRLTMIIIYMWLISLSKEIQRVFEYHGAEHKTIAAFENSMSLTPENAARCTRFHPRCGTSFILIVALSAILVYAIADTIFALIAGHAPSLLERFAVHFALLPLVAGGSYELLKFSAKTSDNPIVRLLIAPGLWLQRITTKEPNKEQLEVAIVALEAALGKTNSNQSVVLSSPA